MNKIMSVKIVEIRKLANKKEYKKALNVLNTIDTYKVKAINDLSLFAIIYEQNKKYMDAKNILLEIYRKNKNKRVIFYLVTIFIKMKYIDEAEKYFKDFLTIAPKDTDRFVLKYKLDKAKNKSFDDLIIDLEELKEHDYLEEWSFELAKLYHKAGYKDKCMKECNDIILWFGEGIIVEKASLLKEYYLGNNEKINALCEKKLEEEYENKIDKVQNKVQDKIQDKVNNHDIIKQEVFIQEEYENNIKQEISKNNDDDKIINQEINKSNDDDKIINQEINKNEDRDKIIKQESNRNDNIDKCSNNVEANNKKTIVEDENIIKIFGNFLKINEELSSQLMDILNWNLESNGPIIITGFDGCGKTNLAKRLLTGFFKMGYIKTAKIAKIKSHKLNNFNLDEKYDKLIGGSLIIEKAGDLTWESIDKLIRLMNNLKGDIIVILEDKKVTMDKLLLVNPNLLNLMVKRIDIPEYDLQAFMGFANEYFTREEYILEDEAITKLKKTIKDILTISKPEERLNSMFCVLRNAKEAAEGRNIKSLSKIVEKGEYKAQDLFKIKETDIFFKK